MPLDRPQLEERIGAMIDELSGEEDAARARERFVELLAAAVEEFVRTGSVTIEGKTGDIT